jgi:type IV pilus assembly protein PilZ
MTLSDAQQDRRGGPRVPVELRVEYKRLNTFFADYTKNISKGGSFIRTKHPLSPGTEFTFVLVIPNMPAPLKLIGKVLWTVGTQEATDEQPAGMGIEFQYQNDGERHEVEAWVERVMVDELGEEITAGLLGRAARV